jgi:hypothetical protein
MSLFSSQSVAAMNGSSSSTAPTTSTSGADISANGSSDAQSSADVVDTEGGVSLFAAALDHLPHVRDANGDITTEGFCEMCELTLPCIGKDARTGGGQNWCEKLRARAPRVVMLRVLKQQQQQQHLNHAAHPVHNKTQPRQSKTKTRSAPRL